MKRSRLRHSLYEIILLDTGHVFGCQRLRDDAADEHALPTDSETDEVVFTMAARRAGTPLLLLEAFHRYGHAGHGMKK